MQNKPPTQKQLNVFVIGLTIILILFSHKAYRSDHIGVWLLLLTFAAVLVITYSTKREFVVKFYYVWMKGVSAIGMVITGILIAAIFYLIFAPVGLFLRLIGKDILNLKKDNKLSTYWIDRPKREFDKTSYEKQF
ncbi:hypothetical protein ACFL2J_05025 [Candidatus Omnitrophota bacterium]